MLSIPDSMRSAISAMDAAGSSPSDNWMTVGSTPLVAHHSLNTTSLTPRRVRSRPKIKAGAYNRRRTSARTLRLSLHRGRASGPRLVAGR